MKAWKYILYHAPYERSDQIDDLFLFFRVRKVKITEELYSLIINNTTSYLRSYVRDQIIRFTHKKFVPQPFVQEPPKTIKSTHKHISNTQPASGLSDDDPIKKTSRINSMIEKAITRHLSDSDYEYGVSDW